MLSAYSWGDFFKVVGALGVPYYLFVVWTYFREDIRDWVARKRSGEEKAGLPPEQPATAVEDEEEQQPFYLVRSYQPSAVQPAEPARATLPGDQTGGGQLKPDTALEEADELEIQDVGPERVGEEADLLAPAPLADDRMAVLPEGFEIPLSVFSDPLEEISLDDIAQVAGSLNRGQAGGVIAKDPADEKAVRLADVINQQEAKPSALAGISFKR